MFTVSWDKQNCDLLLLLMWVIPQVLLQCGPACPWKLQYFTSGMLRYGYGVQRRAMSSCEEASDGGAEAFFIPFTYPALSYGLWKTLFEFSGKAQLGNHGSVQFSSVNSVRLFATPWTAARQTYLSFTSSWSLLKLMSIKSVMPSNHLILCRSLLLLPSIFTSIRVFSNEWVLRIRWPKYWSFSFSISPPNEHSGLISFRMDWFALLAVQGTLKSLLQHHSSKASIL